MKQRINQLVSIIQKASDIHVVTHIDADGITAGAIAVETLRRAGKSYSIEFVKQVDELLLKNLEEKQHELVWFTDLGSSIVSPQQSLSLIVTDHHTCQDEADLSYHFNPHFFGYDGGVDLSGSGATYLVSKHIDSANMDLAGIAVVGACGDLQNRKHRKLVGLNHEIVKDGEKKGVLSETIDIQYFGRETRPIHKLLQFANDPVIPGITGREKAALTFLHDYEIELKNGNKWRYWCDLSLEERRTITSGVAQLLLKKGFGHQTTKRVLGSVYTLDNEQRGSELHDAKEFATLLNSTARYGQFEVGLEICLGDREKNLKKARSLLRGHRQNLVQGMQIAKEEGIEQRDYIQFFHAGKGILDTIVGIVTNMLLNDEQIRSDIPLVGFAFKNESEVKASVRTTQQVVSKGVNLALAIKKAAQQVDGVGGGHNIAAGATIPKGKEEPFLTALETEIKSQLSI